VLGRGIAKAELDNPKTKINKAEIIAIFFILSPSFKPAIAPFGII
jgi:hypothetical protein